MNFSRMMMLVALLGIHTGLASAEELVVIVNDGSPITQLVAEEVADIYLGETTFLGGTRVVPVGFIEGNDARAQFLRSVLSIPDNAFKSHWMKEMFRNGGIPPKELASADAVLEAVRGNKGGIGYIYGKDSVELSGVRSVLALQF